MAQRYKYIRDEKRYTHILKASQKFPRFRHCGSSDNSKAIIFISVFFTDYYRMCVVLLLDTSTRHIQYTNPSSVPGLSLPSMNMELVSFLFLDQRNNTYIIWYTNTLQHYLVYSQMPSSITSHC